MANAMRVFLTPLKENRMHQYLDACREIVANGHRKQGRNGDFYSVHGMMMKFNLQDGFPAVTTKLLNFKAVVAELLGFIRGADSAKTFRDLGTGIWDANANSDYWKGNHYRRGEDDLGRIYGVNWRGWRKHAVQPHPKLRAGVEATYLGIANGSGKSNHPLGKTWEGMIARCYDNKSISYPLYGAVGVYVCDRWLEFSAFAEDAINLPGWSSKETSGDSFEYQLDKDILGNGYEYSPATCCWASAKENSDAKSTRTFIVEKDGAEYAFTNVTDFCNSQGVDPKNFSDLWTGNKNAKSRCGFTLVRVDSKPHTKGVTYVDQFADMIRKLQARQDDRRTIVMAWNPGELDQMALPPCHILYQTHLRDETLDLTMYQRSCDFPLGVPFNIASYALLMHILCRITGLTPGVLTWMGGDCHIYANQMEIMVNDQLTRKPGPLPKLVMSDSLQTLEDFETTAEWSDFDLADYYHQGKVIYPFSV